uniref:Uncharacterized protein n=1 Tax=Branchiostoma floridae TaxID=7739 RepID=C3Y0S0_BRAFL|eukprot:XP_002610043.1 hypothetical protein BRAFLDRAFT_100023 [Branchiostoma floridae]
MEKAIPHIADAMQTVLRYSTDDGFRNRCFAAVQVEDSRELATAVSARLWDIAADKYQVTPPDRVRHSQHRIPNSWQFPENQPVLNLQILNLSWIQPWNFTLRYWYKLGLT